MNIEKNKKVLVALSGGVDSAVSSLLLRKKGFLVEGVFLKLFNDIKKEERAKDLAKELNISLTIIDARRTFKEKVIDYFKEELKTGRTPNPCVVCNQKIKFEILFNKLNQKKFDYIATGHYVRLLKKDNGENFLMKAKDKKKDQSYFLWNIKKEHLSKIIFPLGEMKKEEVKMIGKRKGIITENYKESQEVCFVDNIGEFIQKNIKNKKGKIVDINGFVVGDHCGLAYYTIGQRKGINLPHGPYYVAKKDIKNNLLIVTRSEEDLFQQTLRYNKENFFKDIQFPFEAEAKIRYNGSLERLEVNKNSVVFKKPVKAITPGQSIVFYNKDILLGGGVIN